MTENGKESHVTTAIKKRQQQIFGSGLQCIKNTKIT